MRHRVVHLARYGVQPPTHFAMSGLTLPTGLEGQKLWLPGGLLFMRVGDDWRRTAACLDSACYETWPLGRRVTQTSEEGGAMDQREITRGTQARQGSMDTRTGPKVLGGPETLKIYEKGTAECATDIRRCDARH